MTDVFLVCGFLGAWLLVAGPLFQGAMELREQELDRDGIDDVTADVPRPAPPSRWWWLFPPGALWVHRRRNAAYRRSAFARLSVEHRRQFSGFVNKAAGWLIVSAGAALIAAKETWELVEHNHWPTWTLAVIIVGMLLLSALHTAVRLRLIESLNSAPVPTQS